MQILYRSTLYLTAGALLASQFLTMPAQSAVPFPQRFQNGIVASDHPLASQAGMAVLKRGGNAVDAAIATSMVLSVVRNQSTGIGGGGFMLIHTKAGENVIVDYREVAPKKAHRDMYIGTDQKPVPRLSTVGYMAAGVPGLLSGLNYVSKKFGSRPLKELMQPAIQYAETGWDVDHHFASASALVDKRGARADLKAVFFNADGSPKKIGERARNPKLAKSLRKIADQGIDVFYKGELAQKIVAAMQANGGLITAEDLASYQPKLRTPLFADYRGYQVMSMPPPSSGGTALIEILNFLKPFSIGWNSTGHGSSDHVHLITEAMKHAFSDRANYLGDTDFVDVPLTELTSPAHADKIRDRFDPRQTLDNQKYGKKGLSFSSVWKGMPDDHGTTHFSVMDKYGNVVAATETVNTYFGSQVVIPETGILLNNEMDDFSKQPGVPNAFGLIGNEANAIAPGKKPLSSMTPTIVLKDNKPFMAVGASGGPRIITGTMHAIINVIDFGMNVHEAVAAPRFHHQWVPNQIFIEQDMPKDVRLNLQNKGHALKLGKAENAVQAVMFKDGVFTGASDPRKGGAPAGY